MKKYTIIGGMNGVGKSAFSGVLSRMDFELGVIVDADKLTVQNGGDRLSGRKQAIKIISDCLERGLNFTQETTLSGKRTLNTMNKAREKGYYIRLFYIGIGSAEESILRIKNRVRKGGHDISENDVKRRYESRFDDLLKILPYCNEAQFYDNENGFVYVGEYKCGEIVTAGNYTPSWIKELYSKNQPCFGKCSKK